MKQAVKSTRRRLLGSTVVPLAVAAALSMSHPAGAACSACNPCACSAAAACNACNPCAAKCGACNPCAAKCGACNPCNPCASN